MLTSSGGGGGGVAQCGQLLTGGGVKFAKILLTSYVNAPLAYILQNGVQKDRNHKISGHGRNF